MSDHLISPRSKTRPKTKRPRLHKVILLNDDYTPREFVVAVLKAVFGMGEEWAYKVMMTAHRRAAGVAAVYNPHPPGTKAREGTEAGPAAGTTRRLPTAPEDNQARPRALPQAHERREGKEGVRQSNTR